MQRQIFLFNREQHLHLRASDFDNEPLHYYFYILDETDRYTACINGERKPVDSDLWQSGSSACKWVV